MIVSLYFSSVDIITQIESDKDTMDEGTGSLDLRELGMSVTNWPGHLSPMAEVPDVILGSLADEGHSYRNGSPWSTSDSNIAPADVYIDHDNVSEDIHDIYSPDYQAHISHHQPFLQPDHLVDELYGFLHTNNAFGDVNLSHHLTPTGSSLIGHSMTNALAQQATTDPQLEQGTFGPMVNGLSSSGGGDDKSEVCDFLEKWRFSYKVAGPRHYAIGDQAMHLREMRRPNQITSTDLKGDCYDLQGINWQQLGAAREEARILRNSYLAYIPSETEDDGTMLGLRYRTMPEYGGHARMLKDTDTSFRFRQLNTKYKARFGHFQLRNVIAIPSRNSIFFASSSGVCCFDPTFDTGKCVIDFTKLSLKRDISLPRRITALAAGDGVVIVGGYDGEYAMKSWCSGGDDIFTSGRITDSRDGITNHIHTFPNRRSGVPQAVFCSNDDKVRILDCQTDTFIREHQFPFAVNCSATSPDARLRLLIGDYGYPWVVDAETGKQLLQLGKRQEYGFTCDWSPSGIHLATGHENGMVQIWDVRKWDDPLQIIDKEAGGAKSMHFSPIGGGRPVLLIAKTADIINVVDAVTFKTTQKFDFFGQIGGIRFVPDGSAFFVANADRWFGGFMEFERMSGGGEFAGSSRQHWNIGKEKVEQRWNNLSDGYTDEPESSYEELDIDVGSLVDSSEDEVDDKVRMVHMSSRDMRNNVDYEDVIF